VITLEQTRAHPIIAPHIYAYAKKAEKTGRGNDGKGSENAKSARHLIENEKQNPISVCKCLIVIFKMIYYSLCRQKVRNILFFIMNCCKQV